VVTLVVLIVRSLSVRGLIRRSAYRELAQQAASAADLEAAARRFLSEARYLKNPFLGGFLWTIQVFSPGPRGLIGLLHDPNPNFRYAASLAFSLSDEGARSHSEEFLEALKLERCVLLRRSLAKALATQNVLLETSVLSTIPDAVYYIEARHKVAPTLQLQKPIPKEFLVIRAILDNDLNMAILELFPEKSISVKLCEGLRVGLITQSLVFLEQIQPAELREATKMVSPFESPGLGTNDHLASIERIDELFLFFQEVRFYKNWGDLVLLRS
jgi:hypothetical protein